MNDESQKRVIFGQLLNSIQKDLPNDYMVIVARNGFSVPEGRLRGENHTLLAAMEERGLRYDRPSAIIKFINTLLEPVFDHDPITEMDSIISALQQMDDLVSNESLLNRVMKESDFLPVEYGYSQRDAFFDKQIYVRIKDGMTLSMCSDLFLWLNPTSPILGTQEDLSALIKKGYSALNHPQLKKEYVQRIVDWANKTIPDSEFVTTARKYFGRITVGDTRIEYDKDKSEFKPKVERLVSPVEQLVMYQALQMASLQAEVENMKKKIQVDQPVTNESNALECPVCFDIPNGVTECGHLICLTCNDKLNSCPVCRGPIDSKKTRRVFGLGGGISPK